MQSVLPWQKSARPPPDPKRTLTQLATFCEQQKTKEEELQRRIEQITVKIKATVKGRTPTPAEKKRCMAFLLEKRQCERTLDSVSEQRLRATFTYNAIQGIGNEKDFVSLMTDANECMQAMGLPQMRDKAERASDTANDLANYTKELEDALQHFGASFSFDDTELADELNEILGLPGDGVSPGVLADAPGTASVSSSSFPRVPVAAVNPSPKIPAATSKQPAKETMPSVVSV
jgi:hypothetical protein